MKHACPCCRNLTLEERGRHDICQVCFWEDEYRCDEEPWANDVSGANGMTLAEARRNFAEFGACERAMLGYVRRPTANEIPPAVDAVDPVGATKGSGEVPQADHARDKSDRPDLVPQGSIPQVLDK